MNNAPVRFRDGSVVTCSRGTTLLALRYARPLG